MRGHEMNKNPVEPEHVAELSLAELCCAPGDRVEHRLNVGRRTGDYAQHLASRGLILKRLLKFALACLLRLEQPRVFDGDDGLVGEGLEYLNLLVGEGLYLGTPENQHANRILVTDEGNSNDCSVPQLERTLIGFGVFACCRPQIMHVDNFAIQERSPRDKVACQSDLVSGT